MKKFLIYIPCLLMLLFVFGASLICAQVNTESMRRSGLQPGFHGNVKFGYNLVTGNSQFSAIETGFRLDYVRESFYTFAVLDYQRESENKELFLNRGFIHLRGIYNVRETLKPELFFQKEFSEFILLNDRNLIGGGLRIRTLQTVSTDPGETPLFNSFLGIGLMWEYEEIDLKPVKTTQILRSTNYISVQWNINRLSRFNAVSYYQVDTKDIRDYRVLVQSSLQVGITKYLALTTGLNYRFDNQPPASVEKYDLELTNGFTLTF
jgi:putative salt-induced outer membrane protein YdiY